MPQARITDWIVFEDGGASAMARVLGGDGEPITQASIGTITYKVFDLDSSTPDVADSNGTLSVASVVFDALQTDSRWSADSEGYNFRHDIGDGVFNMGGHIYRIEYRFAPASGAGFWVVFEAYAEAVRSS